MCDHLEEKLKKAGAQIFGREGKTQGDWIVIDALDVVIHLFRPEVREFYGLEKMWSKDAADEVLTVGAEG
jgi:ribosome-associated protein